MHLQENQSDAERHPIRPETANEHQHLLPYINYESLPSEEVLQRVSGNFSFLDILGQCEIWDQGGLRPLVEHENPFPNSLVAARMYADAVRNIDRYRLLHFFTVGHAPGKTVLTYCNLWRLTKYITDSRIFLHTFSLETARWKECDANAILWRQRDKISSLGHYLRYFRKDSVMEFEHSRHIARTWPEIHAYSHLNDLDILQSNLVDEVLLSCGIERYIACMDDIDTPERLEVSALRDTIGQYVASAIWKLGPAWGQSRRVLWKYFLDRRLMSVLCSLYGGRPITLRTYMGMQPHTQELFRISEESQNVLPLLNQIPPNEWHRKDLFKDETLREVAPAFAELSKGNLRLLRKLPSSALCVLHYHQRLRDVLELLQGIQTQEKIPAIVFRRVVKSSWQPLAFPDVHGGIPELQRIYRLFVRHCLALWKQDGWETLKRYLQHNRELSQILTWFLAEGRVWNLLDKNATWASLKRMSGAWHTLFEMSRKIADEREKKSLPHLSWESLVVQRYIDHVLVEPLTSALALHGEGIEMRNCVASYAHRCYAHSYRIFSLTEKDGNRSTLCIRPNGDGAWVVVRHKGACNSDVSRAAGMVADAVCHLYAEAQYQASADEEASASGEEITWESLVKEQEIGGIRVVPITSVADMLQEECATGKTGLVRYAVEEGSVY